MCKGLWVVSMARERSRNGESELSGPVIIADGEADADASGARLSWFQRWQDGGPQGSPRDLREGTHSAFFEPAQR